MSKQPNILLIMADQLVPMLTGTYGHPVVRTPNMDKIGSEGVRFKSAYSSCPVCVPARASMMTGKYISNIPVYDNASPLTCDQPTLAHLLTLAGYDTALAGKMHFVGPDQLHGFQRRFNTNIYPADFRWAEQADAKNPVQKSHVFQYLGKNIRVGGWNQFLSYDEETHMRAKEYLRAQAENHRQRKNSATASVDDDGQPFFLCVSYHHPHEPFQPPLEQWNRYSDEEVEVPEIPERAGLEESYSQLDQWLNTYHGVRSHRHELVDEQSLRRLRRAYYALVSYIDDKVGELMVLLAEQGLLDNTAVILTSDHGDMLGEKAMVQKRTFYEYSSRIPMLIRFPDGAHAGKVVESPVSLVDVMPTLSAMASPEGPSPETESYLASIDGINLLEVIDQQERFAERCVFSEYHSLGAYAPSFMVRDSRYKFIYVHGHGEQLFDLEEDQKEEHDLLMESPVTKSTRPVADRLRGTLLAQFDPERIQDAIEESTGRRLLIKAAMQRAGTSWDFEPFFDPRLGVLDQYLPAGASTSTIPR